jgi:hypothetical protein
MVTTSITMSRLKRIPRLSVLASLFIGLLVLNSSATAWAQDQEAIAKVRDLNKKAVEAYENLDLEESRKFLMQALEVCATEGLNRHTVKATTHVTLGVVLVGGFKQRDGGIKQFRRGLEIDPNIKVPKRLTNPEIQSAFEAAQKEPTAEPPVAEAAPAPEAAPATTGVRGVNHTPVLDGQGGEAILIKATIEGVRFDRVVLAYRPEGASDFLARDMEKDASGEYVARIPEPATHSGSVAYYIEARGRGGLSVANSGSAAEPHVITLSDSPAASDAVARTGRAADSDLVDESEDIGKRRSRRGVPLYFALGIGGGGGWVKGRPEVNPNFLNDQKQVEPINVNSVANAQLLHFTPEVGYFWSRDLLLSLQGRLQLTTGGTEVHHEKCKPAGVCEPATGAIAVLGKATWLLGDQRSKSAIRPFISLSAGGGYIRYLVNVSNYVKDCGPVDAPKDCLDTVAGGGVLVGPSGGFLYNLSDALSLTATATALAGFPRTAINLDLNLGVAYRL